MKKLSCNRQEIGRRPALLAGAIAALLIGLADRSWGQPVVISPEALLAHSQITTYEGPATCIGCHQAEAQAMFGSVHYQEMGDTPAVPNLEGPAGKGPNGGRVMNSYCGTPTTSSRATCATCHAGNGRVPSPQMTAEQLENIDCMMCHQDAYKRTPAPPYRSMDIQGTNGGVHTIQVVIEDETGFQFMPDTAKMTISMLEAAQTVHLPTRASCLRCHAGAGGSDGGKRGDISTVTIDPPLASDVHMSSQGGNLSCAECHSAGNHRVAGRGVDLRPSDSATQLSCTKCHTDRPHGDYNARDGASRDVHAMRVACQSCHIPRYAKDKSTEMERNWSHSEFSMAACRGQGGWLPSEVRASNVIPLYQWFDGTSLANDLGQTPIRNAAGDYVLALPNGSVQGAGAKIYPMKLHRSNSALHDASGLLVPHSTFAYFASGDFSKAIREGQAQSGLEGETHIVNVLEYQTINHGVEMASSALQCGACHSAYTSGGPVRMNLQADLGYGLKGTTAQVCTQCHGSETSGFASVHSRHVKSRGYDCSNCHNFSRTERALSSVKSFPPTAPTGPAVERIAATQVKLAWGDNSSSEQGFRVERSLDGVNFTQIATAGANVRSLIDSNLEAATTYYYRVRAYNATGNSGYSIPGASTTPTPQLRMAAAGQGLELSWPEWGGGYTLESADALTAPVSWATVQGTRVTNNNTISITLPASGSGKFYRLSRP